MKDNDSIDTYMNETLHNLDVSSGSYLLNIHTLLQENESGKLNQMYIGVYNGDVIGYYCYMNISTGCVIKNQNSIG